MGVSSGSEEPRQYYSKDGASDEAGEVGMRGLSVYPPGLAPRRGPVLSSATGPA